MKKKSRKRNGLIFAAAGVLAAACVAAIVTVTFMKNEPSDGMTAGSSGTVIFSVGESFLNGKSVKAGDSAKPGDLIETGVKSSVTVQFADAAVVSLGEKSALRISDLARKNGKLGIFLDQQKGISFNKIRKGAAEYSVRSATVIAAVRGTAFTFSTDERVTRVNLIEGTVRADRPAVTGPTVTLEPGYGISADEKRISAPVKLKKEEKKELEALNAIPIMDLSKPVHTESIPSEALKILTGQGLIIDKKPTLPELEKKLGPLSTITTYEKKVYIGSFRQRGSDMEVTTTDGTVVIPTSKVMSVVPYKVKE